MAESLNVHLFKILEIQCSPPGVFCYFFYWKRRKTWAAAMLFTQQTLCKVWLHITIKEHLWIQHKVRTSDKVEGAANIQKTFNTFTQPLRTVVFEHTTVWLWRVSLHCFRSYPLTELKIKQFNSTIIFPVIIYSYILVIIQLML